MKTGQREFNYYVCELLLTMLDRSPDEGEVKEVQRELQAWMGRFKPTQPARPRASQTQISGINEEDDNGF